MNSVSEPVVVQKPAQESLGLRILAADARRQPTAYFFAYDICHDWYVAVAAYFLKPSAIALCSMSRSRRLCGPDGILRALSCEASRRKSRSVGVITGERSPHSSIRFQYTAVRSTT